MFFVIAVTTCPLALQEEDKKKMANFGNEEAKLSLFSHEMIVYVLNFKN